MVLKSPHRKNGVTSVLYESGQQYLYSVKLHCGFTSVSRGVSNPMDRGYYDFSGALKHTIRFSRIPSTMVSYVAQDEAE